MNFSFVAPALLGPILALSPLSPVPAEPAQPQAGTSVVLDLLDAPGVPVAGDIVPASFGQAPTHMTLLAAFSSPPLQPADDDALRENGQGYEIVTAALEVERFNAAGLTFEGTVPDRVDIRVLEDSGWSDWYTLEIDSEASPGTEAFTTGGADSVQVRISGTVVPDDVSLMLTSGAGSAPTPEEAVAADEQPATSTLSDPSVNEEAAFFVPQRDLDAMPASISHLFGGMPASVAAPNVISRAQWGNTRVPQAWKPVYVPLQSAIIHHTATTNNYTAAQSAAMVRSIDDYHTYGRGWDDIGYNFLVDKYGQVFEGRYGTLTAAPGQMVIGGHAAPANTGSLGISVLGTYTLISPSEIVLSTMENIIAWQFNMAKVDPFGTWTYTDRAGARVSATTILGHKDVSSTACPGLIYNQLGRIRTNVKNKLVGGDPMTVRNNKTIRLFKSDDFAPVSTNVQFFGYPGDELYVGNVTGQGDLPFVRRGNEFIFADGPSSPTTVTRYRLGTGREQVFTGSIDVPGREAIILRSGNRFDIYDSPAQSAPTRSITFGRAEDEVFVYDWDGDGMSEIAVRRGNQFYLKWTVLSGNADRVISYGRAGDEVYPGRWSSNRAETLMVRRGKTYYQSFSARSGNADRQFDYGRATDKVVVGDWNRDGRDGVGVVRLP